MNGPRILARLALGAGLVWLALAGGASAESAPLKPVTLIDGRRAPEYSIIAKLPPQTAWSV